MYDFVGWLQNELKQPLQESIDSTRYSIEVNYRSKIKEILDSYSKITLGFVSAALKKSNFHIKHVFEKEPYRILVSSRNWDDGEWVGMISWNPEHQCFIISKGFFNKDRKTVSVQSNNKCASQNAAEIVKDVINLMHDLKGQPDRHIEKLKKVPLKRGPK